jgi:hypothetical protein
MASPGQERYDLNRFKHPSSKSSKVYIMMFDESTRLKFQEKVSCIKAT